MNSSFIKIAVFFFIVCGIGKSLSRICPDRKSQCQPDQTCCKTMSGQRYNCCPYYGAVCCSDGIHCCPKDYECDLEHMRCIHHTIKSSFEMNRTQAVSNFMDDIAEKVVCPDHNNCPNKYTCCPISGGRYGCCPYQDGTCCSDKVHCCPKGKSCKSGACE